MIFYLFKQVESVNLALNILDGYDVRGHKIKVQQAQFQMKGDYNPALKPKKSKQEKEKAKKQQEKYIKLHSKLCQINHIYAIKLQLIKFAGYLNGVRKNYVVNDQRMRKSLLLKIYLHPNCLIKKFI